MSQASAISKPPPSACPSITAMNTGASAAKRSNTWWARRTIAMFSSAERARNPLTSAPAEKNFSLADLTTPTATPAAATRPIASSSSSRKAGS
jgi:hypothetical protein